MASARLVSPFSSCCVRCSLAPGLAASVALRFVSFCTCCALAASASAGSSFSLAVRFRW